MTQQPRRIFDSRPDSWQELEQRVAQVFREMGCRVATQKERDLPRGKVTVDVVVRDTTTVPHSLYICECKHWRRKVSQSEIHAFRTVVLEAGANRGFLITRSGFQPAALAAAEFTNIDLLTWDQFESLMFDRWLEGVVRDVRPALVYAAKLISCSDDELWDRIGCTEESWHELERLTDGHQFALLWSIFELASKGHKPSQMAEAVVGFGPLSPMDGKPIDTFRRFASQALPSSFRAIAELEAFWNLPDWRLGQAAAV
jgi:Restriction endonuclease